MLSRPEPLWEGSALNAAALRRHFFEASRQATIDELAGISPDLKGTPHCAHFALREGIYVSQVNARFVLADLDRVTQQQIAVMTMLDRALVARTTFKGRPVSVAIVVEHTWALWAWVEAASQGYLASTGAPLLHADDHNDLRCNNVAQRLRGLPLTLDGIGEVIACIVQHEHDPTGIASFIYPATVAGLVGPVYWMYGRGRTGEQYYYDLVKRRRVLRTYERAESWQRKLMPPKAHALERCMAQSDYPAIEYRRSIKELFPEGVFAYRSDHMPFDEIERYCQRDAARRPILDIDIDIADEVEELEREVRRCCENLRDIGCVTIAISPQFGAYDNHLEKVMMLLDLLREFR